MRSPVFDAVLFDLDGVLTTTATLHESARRSTFDTFLDEWDAAHGTSTARFEVADYAAYVDGKPRQDGVRDFLVGRGITLPPGTHDEPPSTQTVWGLGNLKQERVVAELATGLVEAFRGSIAWVRELRKAGLMTAVVSSSQNAAAILEQVGISNLFDTRVDGQTALDDNLPGKPAPDMFLAAAEYRWPTREFAPMLPTRAQRIRFPLRLEGSVLEVTIEPDLVTYTVRSGDPVTARHRGTEFTAEVGKPITFPGDYHTHDGTHDAVVGAS